ncbi:MAG: FadR/GntR family transcriptional regulator, partial [Acidimicrobiales bacterium]
IEVRVGARGGAFLTAPSTSKVSEGLSDMLTMSSLAPEEVTEARLVFELGIIDLVCARADERDLDDLSEICDRSVAALQAGRYTMDLSAEFHVRLGHSTHNRALDLIVESFQEALHMSLFAAQAAAPVMGDPGVHEHRELVEAIARRDPVLARSIMRSHLDRTASRLAPVPGRASAPRPSRAKRAPTAPKVGSSTSRPQPAGPPAGDRRAGR